MQRTYEQMVREARDESRKAIDEGRDPEMVVFTVSEVEMLVLRRQPRPDEHFALSAELVPERICGLLIVETIR